jgi:hypothetical protein
MQFMNRLEQIIRGGGCIGCGACDTAAKGAVPVVMNAYGQYQADVSHAGTLSEENLNRALNVSRSESGTGFQCVSSDL